MRIVNHNNFPCLVLLELLNPKDVDKNASNFRVYKVLYKNTIRYFWPQGKGGLKGGLSALDNEHFDDWKVVHHK